MPNLRDKLRAPRGSVTPDPGKASGWSSPRLRKKNEPCHDSPIARDPRHFSPEPRTPRLDVNFEKPEFERYSVMFEKLLSNESKPSLLERRQSRAHRRKSEMRVGDIKIGERLEAVAQSPGTPKRSMTSPHLDKRLSIRVDSNERHHADDHEPSTAVNRPRQMQRAQTAPLNTTSPLTTVFTRGRKVTLESSPESNESALFSEGSLPSTPATVTTCTDSSSIRREWQDAEPAFDMVTSDHVRGVVAESAHTSTHYPRVTSPEDLERQIVQVSVARQVSVSQARSRVQRAVSSDNFKRPVRPRVVELSKNRKSEVGLLESACEDDDIDPVPSRETSKSGSEIAHAVPETIEQEYGTPRQAPVKAPMGPFPDPLKLNPPTPMAATFAESAKR
ncbi:hypothetical protein CLAFUW4_11290 [Fulvia fulva]|uniref:Uncharacterized protein n=1 Tax=Passalora fulva TaxID=5499 RepID=A0A9Q8PBY6_PASFU|nr:uncharacterized protein CLAFUR5_10331 [Fulvia fulva]KAK4620098.1 hypothetical protein CLAFUR4_11296 [Fulvia fulva]KAK4620704.1 hypothetical protein CLAFUR0_11301 [Fulvia fulva]UJO19654.1 hypothetical protein CLAFUR5_10331 [Fulvia fulva]WPV17553.1 hypothetical protein CLAFUW4_11290 [Fulvia fulva]WPV32142.1 hypothetical protein CLAFUW7_11286 [Fulvia fulva]